MVAFEEFCRAKSCLVFVQKTIPPPGHQVLMAFPRSLGQDKNGNPLFRLNARGERIAGDLDNEMAEVVRHLASLEFSEEKNRPKSKRSDQRFGFAVSQEKARARGVLVPRFWWWEDTKSAMRAWTDKYPSELITLGQMADRGIIKTFEGHGSPPGHSRRTGGVPYVKVTDLKNWRINENPTNFVHQDIADKLRRRGPILQYADLVTPSRASSNIGQFCLIL
jgi:type I restriction enzyme M protein